MVKMNIFFRTKQKKQINECKDLFKFTLNINKIDTHKNENNTNITRCPGSYISMTNM